ncbi:Ribonuclease H domain [Sesbania bispinosa]|nr:Ribonuclease H domain [Sesbania bispinosa]
MKATNILKHGFRFKVGRGDTSFWYANWLDIGTLCSHVEFVNFHDVNLTIRDVFITNAWHLDRLWALVPQDICDSIVAKHFLLNDEDVPVWETTYASISLANVVKDSFDTTPNARQPTLVRWEAPVGDQFALNTDGSVMGNRAGFGGLVRNMNGEWMWGFAGFMGEEDVLMAELTAILRGLHLCWDNNIINVKCMSDSLMAVSLIKEDVSHFHKYACLVKEIRSVINLEWTVSVSHTLREGNMCADYLAKQGAAGDSSLSP